MEDPVLCNLKSGVDDSMLQQLPDDYFVIQLRQQRAVARSLCSYLPDL
jgi:hypothetical protein